MRYWYLALILFFGLNSGYAAVSDTLSVHDKVRIYSGFRFGFGGAKQRNTVIFQNDGKFAINPNISAVLWLRFKQNVGMVTEVNYSLKGIRFVRTVKDTTTVYQRRLHYVEFPILFQASIGTKKFSEYMEIGFVPSYVAGAYDQSTAFVNKKPVSTESSEFFYNKAIDNPTKRFDISMLLGAGMTVEAGPGLLQAGFRTNIGFLDVNKINRIGYYNQPQRQFSFQLQLGYVWYIKSVQ